MSYKIEGESRTLLLEMIARGESLADWLRLPGAPKRDLYYAAFRRDPELQAEMEVARAIGYDAIAEETLNIVDTKPERVQSPTGGSHYDSAHVQWLKNRAYQRMQLLAKWYPAKYGEKTTTALTGADGGAIKVEGIVVKYVKPDAS